MGIEGRIESQIGRAREKQTGRQVEQSVVVQQVKPGGRQFDRRGGRNEIEPRGPGRTSGRLRSVVPLGPTPDINRLDRAPQRTCFPLRERPLPFRRRHYGATLARVKQFFALSPVFSGPQEIRGRDARIAVTLRSIDRERTPPAEDSPVHLSLNP